MVVSEERRKGRVTGRVGMGMIKLSVIYMYDVVLLGGHMTFI